MKPILFPKAGKELSPPQYSNDLHQRLNLQPSDMETITISWNPTPLWDPSSLTDFLKSIGYKPRRCNFYTTPSLTITRESIHWHHDKGMGLTICWLLFNTDAYCNYSPELITRYGATEMNVGDICIFNADRGHAWIANGISIMLIATLAKIKSTKSICNKT